MSIQWDPVYRLAPITHHSTYTDKTDVNMPLAGSGCAGVTGRDRVLRGHIQFVPIYGSVHNVRWGEGVKEGRTLLFYL